MLASVSVTPTVPSTTWCVVPVVSVTVSVPPSLSPLLLTVMAPSMPGEVSVRLEPTTLQVPLPAKVIAVPPVMVAVIP